MNTTKIRRAVPAALLITPFMILFLLFTVIPVLTVIFSIFISDNTGGGISVLRSFAEAFADPVFLTGLRNTVILFITGFPLSFACGTLVAFMLSNSPPFLGRILLPVFTLPFLTLLTGSFPYLFSDEWRGYYNSFFMNHFSSALEPVIFSEKLLIVFIGRVLLTFPVCFLLMYSAFCNMPREYHEALILEETPNPFIELYYIAIPAIKMKACFSLLITGIYFLVTEEVYLGSNVPTLAAYAKLRILDGNEGIASAAHIILWIFAAGFYILLKKAVHYQKKEAKTDETV